MLENQTRNQSTALMTTQKNLIYLLSARIPKEDNEKLFPGSEKDRFRCIYGKKGHVY